MSGNPIIINVPDDKKGIKVKYVVQWKQHDSSKKQERWYFVVTFNGITKSHTDTIDAPIIPDESSGEFEWIEEYKGKRAKPLELTFSLDMWLEFRDWTSGDFKSASRFDSVDVIINYPLYKPKIDVEPSSLAWIDVKVNGAGDPAKRLIISNIGEEGSILSWKIKEKPDYLYTYDGAGETSAGDSDVVDIYLNREKLEANNEYTGRIVIDSNGGTAIVNIKVTTPKSKEISERHMQDVRNPNSITSQPKLDVLHYNFKAFLHQLKNSRSLQSPKPPKGIPRQIIR